MSRIQIFDHFGYRIAEFNANASRTWKVSDYGRCAFEIPIINPKCTQANLQFGNFVYIEHPRLPPWGGVIDVPRKWNKHTVLVYAYSGEYIFKFRRVEAINTVTLSPGEIFNQIIDLANREGDTRITKGSIFTDDEAVRWELNLLKIYDEIVRLAEDTDNEWKVKPELESGGQIQFKAYWNKELGVNTNYLLKEGLNIEAEDDIISEDGEIANDIYGIGPGAAQTSRNNVNLLDIDSIGTYGLRQSSVSFQEGEYSSVEIGTKAMLKKKKNPSKTFSLTATDYIETWNNMDIGNTFLLQMSNVGFQNNSFGVNTQVRVTGMTYDEENEKLNLNCEEVE